MPLLLKSLAIVLLISLAETIHGILRTVYLNPRIGDRRARQVGVISGSIIILTIAWFTVPRIGIRTREDGYIVGAVWTFAMLAFEFGLGRWYFHFTWQRLFAEFDVRKGGFLAFGMAVLFFAPTIVTALR